jgi:hypothetical protein
MSFLKTQQIGISRIVEGLSLGAHWAEESRFGVNYSDTSLLNNPSKPIGISSLEHPMIFFRDTL